MACDGASGQSAAAPFVTALWDGFDPRAAYVWAAPPDAKRFALFRHDVAFEAPVAEALLFVTACGCRSKRARRQPRR